MTGAVDIFISIRDDVRYVAEALDGHLSDAGYAVSYWGKNGAIRTDEHFRISQNNLINESIVTIIVTSPTGLGDGICWQADEIRTAYNRSRPELAQRPDTYNRRTIFVDAPSPDPDAYRTDAQQLASLHRRVHDRFGDLAEIKSLRYVLLHQHPDIDARSFYSEIEALAATILTEYRPLLNAARPDAAPSASDRGPAGSGIVKQLTADAYLTPERYAYWLRGTIREDDIVDPASIRSDQAFAFNPAHFIPLSGAEPREGGAKPVICPLIGTIFAPLESGRAGDRRLLYIGGPPGAGKTVMLATAAALAAAGRNGRLDAFVATSAGHRAAIDDGGTTIRDEMTLRIPIVLTARRLSDAIASHGSLPAALRALGIDTLISEKNVLLCIDALDRIDAARASELIGLLAALLARQDERGFSTRIVIAGSTALAEADRALVQRIDIGAPDWDQIDSFLSRFLSTQRLRDGAAVGDALADLRRRVRSLFVSPETADLVTNPMLLKAFCQNCVRDDQSIDDIGSRKEFCQALLAHLLTRRSVRLALPVDRKKEAGIVLERLLQRIARIGYSDGDGRTDADLAEDIADGLIREMPSGLCSGEELIRIACAHSGILSRVRDDRQGDYVVVSPPLLAHYLTALDWQHDIDAGMIDVTALCAEAMGPDGSRCIAQAAHDLRRHQTLGLLFKLLQAPDRMTRSALDLPETLLKGAGERRSPRWFVAACRIFDNGAGSRLFQDQRAKALATRALTTYRNLGGRERAAVRAKMIDALAQIAHRRGSSKTRAALHDLLDDLTLSSLAWIDTGLQSDCGGSLWIAARPVLVADYADFLNSTPRDPWPPHLPLAHTIAGIEYRHRRSFDRLPYERWTEIAGRLATPITDITWVEAIAYARFAQKEIDQQENGPATVRLMTIAEWTRVQAWASGGALYIWGGTERPADLRDGPVANLLVAAERAAPTPIGTFPGLRDTGAVDLGSNVATWLIDALEPHGWLPRKPEEDEERFVPHTRGRWTATIDDMRSTLTPLRDDFDERLQAVGLRLVRIVPRKDQQP